MRKVPKSNINNNDFVNLATELQKHNLNNVNLDMHILIFVYYFCFIYN